MFLVDFDNMDVTGSQGIDNVGTISFIFSSLIFTLAGLCTWTMISDFR